MQIRAIVSRAIFTHLIRIARICNPSAYNQTNLPKPNDSSISIITSEPEYVAVIQFGGFASNESIDKHRAMLENELKNKGLSYYGDFRFLGYNPPYQLFERKNEVIVALNWNSK